MKSLPSVSKICGFHEGKATIESMSHKTRNPPRIARQYLTSSLRGSYKSYDTSFAFFLPSVVETDDCSRLHDLATSRTTNFRNLISIIQHPYRECPKVTLVRAKRSMYICMCIVEPYHCIAKSRIRRRDSWSELDAYLTNANPRSSSPLTEFCKDCCLFGRVKLWGRYQTM